MALIRALECDIFLVPRSCHLFGEDEYCRCLLFVSSAEKERQSCEGTTTRACRTLRRGPSSRATPHLPIAAPTDSPRALER